MNKKLLVGIGVIVIIAFLIFSGFLNPLNEPLNKLVAGEPDVSCNVDSDCVFRVTSCSCERGAVNKNWKPFCPLNFGNILQCAPYKSLPQVKCVSNQCQEVWEGGESLEGNPSATKDVFENPLDYAGKTFRFKGCFELERATMTPPEEECNLDNLQYCYGKVTNYDTTLTVDIRSLSSEKLEEIFEGTKEVEITGNIQETAPIMYPMLIKAEDLKVLEDCT